MKYYVTADVHGFFSILKDTLSESGFFVDTEPHRLVILGDLFDRGTEARELQDFVLDLMEKDEIILIRGNHEDLYEALVTEDQGRPLDHHVHNGTFGTALQLTGYDFVMARQRNNDFAEAAKQTPYYQRIIPAMLNYYETEHYVFVHGWIPCIYDWGNYCYVDDWRDASPEEWREARWSNGIDAAQSCRENKTILCGHWHTSYGHCKYESKGCEFGTDADFSPYYGPRVIALDACTAHSGKMNLIILND